MDIRKEKVVCLPPDKPIATHCSWGGRGGLGASILKSMGFKEVYNLLGGMQAWKKMGYPIVKEGRARIKERQDWSTK